MKMKAVRCAIYTRVSTEQGLEQDFNSLDAQHDASHAYVRSQAHAISAASDEPEFTFRGAKLVPLSLTSA
jgi:DNA invertase Pin-like site-specific DNA recombinase